MLDSSDNGLFSQAFHLFDINRDGYIDREDLRFTFTSMGKPDVSEEALDQMLSEMSSNAVDFDTFVKLFGFVFIITLISLAKYSVPLINA